MGKHIGNTLGNSFGHLKIMVLVFLELGFFSRRGSFWPNLVGAFIRPFQGWMNEKPKGSPISFPELASLFAFFFFLLFRGSLCFPLPRQKRYIILLGF